MTQAEVIVSLWFILLALDCLLEVVNTCLSITDASQVDSQVQEDSILTILFVICVALAQIKSLFKVIDALIKLSKTHVGQTSVEVNIAVGWVFFNTDLIMSEGLLILTEHLVALACIHVVLS